MDTLESCLNLVERHCFMASIDLANAYHSVATHKDFTKYFKFQFKQQLYKYLVLPQGYRDSPRIFTKITKPTVARLHEKKITCSLYIDDLYAQGSDFLKCQHNVNYACTIFESLGFQISPKSALIPSQELEHLGFVLNSENMTVSLGKNKKDHIYKMITKLPHTMKVRTLAQIIGTLVACLPAVEYGRLYYRLLEVLKIKALKESYNFTKEVTLTKEALDDLEWWTSEGLNIVKILVREHPIATVKTDASGYAWGAVLNGVTTHGMWSDQERKEHINVLELKAALFGTQSLCREFRNCHMRIGLDNTTAVAYINNMGGTNSLSCNTITRELLLRCKARHIWRSACHIPGIDNTTADRHSRKHSIHTEWTLSKTIFLNICSKFGTPSIDLFAARTNHQLPGYMSLYPDPQAEAINAFFHFWTGYVCIFPPFNLISRVLKKLREDKREKALVIVPELKRNPGFLNRKKILEIEPLYLSQSKRLLAELVTLCALVTGHRCQSLHALDITNMHISSSKAVFYLQTLLKTNSPKNPASVITLAAYREDRRMCVFTCLKHYLKRTRPLRTSNQLFISSQSPHNGVTKDTLARWIKLTLTKSGIDTSIFKAHSTRAAAARTSDVSLVLRSAGWTKETTFAKFYNKPIVNNLPQSNFAHSVLKSKSKSVSL
ncbi:Gag-Pol polyprotein [Plakobranchus ocellatus]|uniref:Gag-Pol polyprotein n=1 Tax=Plakobranchus ocellatus TaxID=259542 RepID=A0AAV3YE61_9GAST|nr:Gag-Pol polyprotein [Plakobranchus ocellatus]